MTDIKRVTLFKIKPNIDFVDYLKGGLAQYDHVQGDGFEAYIKFQVGGGAEKSEEQIPWLRFLNAGFQSKKYHYKSSNRFPRAVMAVKFTVEGAGTRHYVATFGQHADSFFDKNRIVHDFGIRVGMNICDTDRLRRVQTTAHESISRQTERQASVGANLRVFGINTDSEFLRTISGFVKPAYKEIVESFRGRDSISIKLPRDKQIAWADLISICRRLDERYYANDYRDTEFKVYDTLRHETDPEIVAQLDALLCTKLAARDFSKVHLSPPEFVESEDMDFAYVPDADGDPPSLYEDLRVEDLVGVPRRRLKGLTTATLKSWSIYEFNSEQNFVHVKRYTSGASSISHIFTQTKLYSHAFSTDAETRKGVGEWIDASAEPENEGKDRAAFKALVPPDVRISEPDYTVIFCLLHDKDAFAITDLPFMSQYELMLTHRFLTEDRRYNVGVVFRKVELGATA